MEGAPGLGEPSPEGTPDHNSNIETSLSRGLSTPRRCSYCNKVMFFKAYRCKQCRYRCHKKCAGSGSSSSRRSSSCPKSYSGEEHWTKVLQANEVNSNVVLLPCTTSKKHHCHKDRHRRKSRHHSPCPTPPRQPKAEPKDSNIFTTLYARFCQWVATARREAAAGQQSRPLSRSSSVTSARSQDQLHLLSQLSEDCAHYHSGCLHASISSEDSEYSLARPSYSSTCSSLTITSTSTTHSDLPAASLDQDGYFSAWLSSADSRYASYPDKRNGLSPLTFTISCPLRTNKPSVSQPEPERQNLCATWPLTGRKKFDRERDFSGDFGSSHEDGDEGVFCDGSLFPIRGGANVDDPVVEFSIPHGDIEFSDKVRVGRRRHVYKGKWHGDVMIHEYTDLPETETRRFLEDVTALSRIRHENVTLFMGACVEHPHLAVITSVPKGGSLYERIHLQREKMSLHTRVNIVRQIAQGIGYLHAKGLVMRKLNSRNIHLEPKVKLSLADYGMTEARHDRPGYGCLPRGNLTYIAPEMLRHLRVESPRLVTHTPYTTQTDIFAFGTVLYELIASRFPFRGYGAETLIYSVVKGRRQSLRELRCNGQLKSLIEQCWTHEPDDRPAMSNINKDLQQNGALHKRHSSSVPERLNRLSIDKSDAMFH